MGMGMGMDWTAVAIIVGGQAGVWGVMVLVSILSRKGAR